jgi:hypothetical protein
MARLSGLALACLGLIACSTVRTQDASVPHADAPRDVTIARENTDARTGAPHAGAARGATRSAFHLVLDGAGREILGIHHGAPFFVAGWFRQQHMIARNEKHGLFVRDARLLRGLTETAGWFIHDVFGNLKDGALAHIRRTNGNTDWSEIYRRHADGWKYISSEPVGVSYLAVQPWTGRSHLAYVVSGIPMKSTGAKYGFKIVAGSTTTLVVPQVKMETAARGDIWGPRPHVSPEAFAAFTSGHVIVIGSRAFEYFTPGATRGVVGILPSTPRPVSGRVDLAKFGDNEVLVALDNGPAHFDGKSWTSWPLPDGSPANNVAHHDGHWWAASSNRIYRRVHSRWESIPVPPPQADVTREIVDIVSSGDALWLLESTTRHANRSSTTSYRLWSSQAPRRGVQVLVPLKEGDSVLGAPPAVE